MRTMKTAAVSSMLALATVGTLTIPTAPAEAGYRAGAWRYGYYRRPNYGGALAVPRAARAMDLRAKKRKRAYPQELRSAVVSEQCLYAFASVSRPNCRSLA